MQNINAKGQGRLFQNKYLESLTKTHPSIILSIYVPASLFSLWYYINHFNAPVLTAIGIFLSGLLFWTLIEYMLHRFIFHFVNDNPMVQKFHYTIHGIHHEYPKDKERLVMPLVPSLVFVVFFYSIYYALLGNMVYAFFPGFVIGYLCYAMTHYAIHAIKPPKNFKYLWKHHNLHHYKCPDRAYGVSSPLWDYVFGTMPPNEYR